MTSDKAEWEQVAARCAASNLRRADRALNQFYARFLAPAGLEPTQFTLLTACSLAGEVSVTNLAQILAMDRTTLTRNLKPLEAQGWIETAVGEDRRVRVIRMTEDGSRVLHRALPLWKQAQARLEQAFGVERLADALGEIANLEALARHP